jgi:PAS domain S-box-containing protein
MVFGTVTTAFFFLGNTSAAALFRMLLNIAYNIGIIWIVAKLRFSRLALRESEEKFRCLVDQTRDHAIFMLDPDGRVITWNSGAEAIKGYTEWEVIGRHMSCFYVAEDIAQGKPGRLLQAAAEHALVEDEGWRVRKDGSRFWAEVTISALHDKSGRLRGFSKVTRDITERKLAEQQIAHLASFPELNASPILEIDLQGNVTYANPVARTRFPDVAEIGTKHPLLKEWPSIRAALGTDVQHQVFVREVQTDGAVFHQTFNYLPDAGIVRVYFADISERRRAEEERETTVEFLRLVNQSRGTRDLIQTATTFFQQRSACEAVGIRLQEGDDYPYYEARGFPPQFLQIENSLCSRDAAGKVIRDRSGHPAIECMCGNVILGRVDPSKPFFTAKGSFWANDTTRLLATTTDADRQTRTRNRCNGERYESVALIPLRVGQESLGLLQLNDRQKGRFSLATILLWERLAGYLAVSLSKFRADEALRQQANLLRLSFDAIVVWRLGGVIESWNLGAERLYGYNESEALGRITHELLRTIHPVPWPEIEARLRESGHWEGELRHFTKEGREVVVSARKQLIRGADGIERILESNRDITAHKRAEEALRVSEERLRQGADLVGLLPYTWEPLSGALHPDMRLKALWGLPPDAVINREEFLAGVHPEDRIYLEERRARSLDPAGDGIYEAEYRVIGVDGIQRWISSRGRTTFADGKPIFHLGVALDITARKRADEALLRSEKLASVGRMAATIAHEINNPLAAVTNTLFLARTNLDQPQLLAQYLDLADEELRRVGHIARQALGFYRESNAPALMSVNAVLESAVDLLKSRIKAKQAVIERQWNQVVEVTAVAGELRQVFSNLLANSLDAIDEEGTIKFRVSTGSASNGNRHVRVTVADNGRGIGAGARQHIFEPFFTTKGTIGTGLGLWVSKQIIEKHGGTIRMRSHSDGTRRGTVFSIVLPIKPVAEAHRQSAGV